VISGHYIVNLFRSHWVLLIFAFCFVGIFQVLIISLVVEADLLGMVEQIYQRMPPQMQMLLGEQFLTQLSAEGAIAFGYNYPLVLVVAILVAILLPARHIAGEIETGTLELLFTFPIRRSVVTVSLWLGSMSALMMVIIGCWAGTGLGLLLFPEARGIDAMTIGVVGISLWLLAVTISSYTLLISSFVTESGKALLRATGTTLVFYFVNFAVVMWPSIDFLRPFTVFQYHQPQRLITNTADLWMSALVLGIVSLCSVALSVSKMNRRDIPA
jgi:ABC-type transport system involved in multi-copper enzyme maturation permease subunit